MDMQFPPISERCKFELISWRWWWWIFHRLVWIRKWPSEITIYCCFLQLALRNSQNCFVCDLKREIWRDELNLAVDFVCEIERTPRSSAEATTTIQFRVDYWLREESSKAPHDHAKEVSESGRTMSRDSFNPRKVRIYSMCSRPSDTAATQWPHSTQMVAIMHFLIHSSSGWSKRASTMKNLQITKSLANRCKIIIIF